MWCLRVTCDRCVMSFTLGRWREIAFLGALRHVHDLLCQLNSRTTVYFALGSFGTSHVFFHSVW